MIHTKKLNIKHFSINRVVILLTLSDVFTWGGFYVVSSLAGIYLAGKLGENVVEFVGIGSGIYFFTRGVLQIPIGIMADHFKRDRDDILFLAVGCVLMGLPFVFYPQINNEYVYFFFQFIFGLGASLNLVNWRKLFARNIDEGREGLEYGGYETIMSMTTAALTSLGGVVAMLSPHYFDLVMAITGCYMMIGGFMAGLLLIVDGRKSDNMVK